MPAESSSSCITLQQTYSPSESIEVIGAESDIGSLLPTPLSELISPDSKVEIITSDSCTSISESVEVIDGVGILEDADDAPRADTISAVAPPAIREEEDEDESASYNTILEKAVPISKSPQQRPITTPPSRSNLSLSLTVKSNVMPAKQLNLEKSLESFEAQTQCSDSTHSFEDVQQMLIDDKQSETKPSESAADAQTEEAGGQSSADRADLVKVSVLKNTEQHSGNTSCDEVETATSSDIEIISGPNGDSSSTNSITGYGIYKIHPMKSSDLSGHSSYVVCGSDAKRRGHTRDFSGTSTYSMQSESGSDGCTELDRLHRRVTELAEVVEVRELKLVELGRENAKLFEKNSELQYQLDAIQSRTDSTDAANISDEFTQRLSALERKFQQTLHERDSLRAELLSIQSSASETVPKKEYEREVKERDEIIGELKLEGEKLSKQLLQHSNIIKKLRAKEKESEAMIKRQAEQIGELTSELDRSKKSLSAKDGVERSQMEAVHKLTSENKKLAKELAQVRSELDDVAQRLRTTQTSFDAAKNELSDKEHSLQTLTRKAKDVTALLAESQSLQQQNKQMAAELEALRTKLKSEASDQISQHQKTRQENVLLRQRLEQIEQRTEEQTHAITEATIPLMRQCESLQAALNSRSLGWEKQENAYLERIEALEAKLRDVANGERSAAEHTDQLSSRIQTLESSLSKALLRSEQTATALQQSQVELEILQSDLQTKQTHFAEEVERYEKMMRELRTRVGELEEQATRTRSERAKSQELNEDDNDATSSKSSTEKCEKELRRMESNSSPTSSVSRFSVAESSTINQWPLVRQTTPVPSERKSIENFLPGRYRVNFNSGTPSSPVDE